MPFLAPFPVRGRNISLQPILEHVSGVSPRTVMNRPFDPRPRDFVDAHEISWHQS